MDDDLGMDSIDFDSPGTGNGGNEFTGYSNSGIFSSPAVRAYDNSDLGEKSRYALETAAQRENNVAQRQKFGLKEYSEMKNSIFPTSPSPSPQVSYGGFSGGGAAMNTNPNNEPYAPGASNPRSDYDPTKATAGQAPSSGGGSSSGGGGRSGGGGGRSIRGGGGGLGSLLPDPTAGQHTVQPSPFPFQPVIPMPGSGVKRAFFSAQEDLLKAMAPYWLQQFK